MQKTHSQRKHPPPLHLTLIVSGANGGVGGINRSLVGQSEEDGGGTRGTLEPSGRGRHPLCKEVLIHLQGAGSGKVKLEKLRGADVHKDRGASGLA